MMNRDNAIHCPEGALGVIRVDEERWSFEYPRISWEVMEEFHEAIEDWRVGDLEVAEEAYGQLIESYPEFIDVHHHLALLFSYTDREEQAFQVWQEVVALGLSCLPAEFQIGRDLLPWVILENRPFLRAYHGLGLEYLERDEFETALEGYRPQLGQNGTISHKGNIDNALASGKLFNIQIRPYRALNCCFSAVNG